MGGKSNRRYSPKKSLIWRIIRFFGVLVLILVAALAVCWFALRDQILGKVLETVKSELSGSGLYLEIDSHHLSWNGAAMFEGVELYSDEGREERVATLEQLSIRIPFDDLIRGDSRMVVSTRDCGLKIETKAGDLELEEMRFKFDVDAQSLSIDHFESRFQGLQVTLDGGIQWQAADAVEGDPGEEPDKIMIPDLSPVVKAASWLEFPEGNPTLAVTVNPGKTPDDDHEVAIVFSGENFRWKSLPLDTAQLELVLAEGAVGLQAMSLDGFGGNLSGGLTIDYQNDRIILNEIESSMDPFRLVEALPLTGSVIRSMKRFRSLGSPSVSGDGIIFDLADFSHSKGIFNVDTEEGIGLTLSEGEAVLTDLRAKVEFSDGSLAVDAERFSAFGGSGSGHFSLPTSGAFSYQAKINGSGFSAARMSKAIGGRDDYTGAVSVNYSGSGASEPRSHAGKGRVDVSDGNFYSIPVFGGLRSFLQTQSKVFGDDVAGNLGMDFNLKNGVIRSTNLNIEGNSTKIHVEGEVDHVGKTVNLNLQAGLKGLVGALTSVVGKILTVHGEGPMESIDWTLAPFSVFSGTPLKDLGDGAVSVFDKTGEVVDDVGDALKKGAKGAFDGIFGRKKDKEGKKE